MTIGFAARTGKLAVTRGWGQDRPNLLNDCTSAIPPIASIGTVNPSRLEVSEANIKFCMRQLSRFSFEGADWHGSSVRAGQPETGSGEKVFKFRLSALAPTCPCHHHQV